ncbi:MAG: hypothetical protein ACLQVD_02695 [Capsulimonadaceae bacterium]
MRPTTDSSSQTPSDPELPSATPDDVETTDISIAAMPWLREDLEDAPFWKEVTAFNQLPMSLIDEYFGKYVAVYQGNIVDSDTDEGELAFRFYRTFGYVPVYIHKVGTEEGLVDTYDLE